MRIFRGKVLLTNLLFVGQLCSALISTTNSGLPDSNRVFVAGLSNQCSSEILYETFGRYGTVSDVSIIGLDGGGYKSRKSVKPYAFVTFDSAQSAENAILYFKQNFHSYRDNGENDTCGDDTRLRPINTCGSNTLFFSEVKRANPIDKSKRKRSNSSRQKEKSERMNIINACEKTNLILQVQSSHLGRLKDYIRRMECVDDNPDNSSTLVSQVEGSSNAVTRNMSLLFISASQPTKLAKILGEDEVLARALKKAYVVNKGAIEANLADSSGGCRNVIDDLFSKIDTNDRVYRIHSFPPSLQSNILRAIEKNAVERSGEAIVRMDPRQFTDILSIVQVYEFKGRGQERTKAKALVMSGTSPSFAPNSVQIGTDNETDGAVSRAYYKLKEAIDRYAKDHKGFDREIFRGAVAIDCGAAPGGWTNFLADDLKCSRVYSIDPGELEIRLDVAKHMQMKIQDAIPLLSKNGARINIFVSDMCLHHMETQLDYLLRAKDQGILEKNAFFVLTLKCKIGYSKDAFDQQVSNVLDILSKKVDVSGTTVYHLFSNRKGERTVMGFFV